MATARVGTACAGPGERAYGVIKAGKLAAGSSIDVPVAVIQGNLPGPWLYVGAAVHGDEVNPIEVLRRVIPAIDPYRLRGTIAAVTVVNPLALQDRNRWAPQDKEDMNRVWPGKQQGKVSERIAYAVFNEAVTHADAAVDLHTGATNMAVHVVYAEGDLASRNLALAFGSDLLLEERRDEKWERARFQGKLRSIMTDRGTPAITPELGGSKTFQEGPIRSGVAGLYGVLDYLGMFSSGQPSPKRRTTLSGSHLDSITASGAGMFVSDTQPGSVVQAGQRIGYLYRPADFSIAEEFFAPYGGLILSLTDNPVVDTGGYVASLCEIKSVE